MLRAPKVSSNAEGRNGKSFREGRDFRDWRFRHHSSETELLVLRKKSEPPARGKPRQSAARASYLLT